ncbi:MAG TPA: TetR/AcrR family transcriptional regulator [Candidatus Obscuribacterales bacterium]
MTARRAKPVQGSTNQQPAPRLAMDKRAQILEGALRVFLTAGFNDTTMDRVAEEAGVSKQTIYTYFHSKERLFKELVEHLADRLFPADLPLPGSDLEPPAFLNKLAWAFFERMDRWQYQSFFRLVMAESARFPELVQIYVRRAVEPGTRLLEAYFVAHPSAGVSDPQAAARIFRSALASFALGQEILHGKHVLPLARERFVRALVDMVLGSGRQGA